MRKRKLIAHHSDARTAHVLSHVPFAFNAGDIDWHCPQCDTLIFSQTNENQHYDVLIECPRCRSAVSMPGRGLTEQLQVVAENGTHTSAGSSFHLAGRRTAGEFI